MYIITYLNFSIVPLDLEVCCFQMRWKRDSGNAMNPIIFHELK